MKPGRISIILLIIPVFLYMTPSFSAGQEDTWIVFERTYLLGPLNGAVGKDSIFVTASGNTYKSNSYLYIEAYIYNPKVTVYKDREIYQLRIQDLNLTIPAEKIETERAQADISSRAQMPDVTESYIVSAFSGLAKGNKYELENGQVWEQTDSPSQVWIAAMPPVRLWRSGENYKMRVEPSDQIVTVRRIR